MQNLKTFKIAYEHDSLITCHNFFDVTDTDYNLELTCPIFTNMD
jgi:hypothetical protein